MRRLGWLVVAPALLLGLPRPSAARYEYARALGARCSTCHESHHPDVQNLNPAGRYYLAHGTLDGWRGGTAPAAAAPRSGQPLFARNCAPCHGARGEGTAKARPLSPPQRARSQAEIETLLRDGIAGTAMFGFQEVLSTEQIRALAAYVQTLRER